MGEAKDYIDTMDSCDTSPTQKKSHGPSDKEHPVLFRSPSQS
jgi:hypothetical protein